MALQYKIGQVAALLNISPDTLRFYEKKGLLEPGKSPENGYRSYSYNDLYRLIDIIFYRRLDLGLDDIRQLLTQDDLPAIIDLLSEKKQAVANKISQLQLTQKKLETIESICRQIPQLLDRYVLESFGPVYQITRQMASPEAIPEGLSIFSQEHFELSMHLCFLQQSSGHWCECDDWQVVLDCALAVELGLSEQLQALPTLYYEHCYRTIARLVDGVDTLDDAASGLYAHLQRDGRQLRDTIFYDYICSSTENGQPICYYTLYAPV